MHAECPRIMKLTVSHHLQKAETQFWFPSPEPLRLPAVPCDPVYEYHRQYGRQGETLESPTLTENMFDIKHSVAYLDKREDPQWAMLVVGF